MLQHSSLLRLPVGYPSMAWWRVGGRTDSTYYPADTRFVRSRFRWQPVIA